MPLHSRPVCAQKVSVPRLPTRSHHQLSRNSARSGHKETARVKTF